MTVSASTAPPTSPKPDGSRLSLKRILPIALVGLLGISLSISAFVLVRRVEQRRLAREFRWRARSETEALRDSIRRYEESIYIIRDLFSSAEPASYSGFRATAKDIRLRHSGIHLLGWAPRVSSSNRATFEAEARQQISPTFQIHGASPDVSESSQERSDAISLEYLDPPEGNEFQYGLDLATGPYQDAIFRARDTGELMATGRMSLERSRAGFGWTFFLPVYEPGAEPQTPAERRERLHGIVEGVFSLSDFAAANSDEMPAGVIELMLEDHTPGATERYLISLSNRKWNFAPSPGPADFSVGLHRDVGFSVGGREWRLYLRPSPAWLETQRTAYPYAFLAAGMILTGLLVSLLVSAQRRARVISDLVRFRTAELRETQEELRGDIRRRDEAERALRASEERYRAFVAQSTEAIWCYEINPPISTAWPISEQIEHFFQHAWMAECNDAMAHQYGFASSKEIRGKPASNILPAWDTKKSAHFRAFIQQGYQFTDREMTTVDAKGEARVFLVNVTGFVEGGLLFRAWGMQRDITERKRHEQIRVEQDTRLRVAVSAAHLGTWDWSLKEQRAVWSPETEKMFGLEAGEFDGGLESFLRFIHPDDLDRIREVVCAAMQDGGEPGADHELRIIRRDGSIRWLVARGTVLRDTEGQPTRMIGTVLDATVQRMADEEHNRIERKLLEAQKLESLGVLAGGIAHDFNNLLTGVLGNASLARMELPEDHSVQPCLEQIEHVAERAADLCKQMLAYSGKGRFVVQRLDLSATVRGTADLIRLSINKSAVLKLSLANDLPAVTADATQLRQIIMNLVINASDAITERSGLINVSTGVLHADRAYLSETYLAPNLPEGQYVFLEVSDNGCGMSPETAKKIFDPFFTTKFTGRGLGLAAVLGIVRGHQGALKVYSELGYGTTFKLLLPSADGSSEILKTPSADPIPEWRGSGTILLVDDEETVRTVSERILRRMGFEVVLATNGLEALEVFQAEAGRFCAVLLDLTMPQLDGNATFTELRRIQPDIRVLLMSGFNEQDATHRFAGKGLSGFVQKPFEAATLRAKLHAMLESLP